MYSVGRRFTSKDGYEFEIVGIIDRDKRFIKFDLYEDDIVDANIMCIKRNQIKIEKVTGGVFSVGKIFKTNEGYNIKIIKQNDVYKRVVKFLDDHGYEVEVYTSTISSGKLRNPYHKSVFGIGYLGVGDNVAVDAINRKSTKAYSVWNGIIKRCNSDKFINYINVKVCDEWLCFQSFANWYNKLYIDGYDMQIDKDLLQRDVVNKIYSPETCTLLPSNINNFLVDRPFKSTGLNGIDKINKGFKVSICDFETKYKINLGVYDTLDEAKLVWNKNRIEQVDKVKNKMRNIGIYENNIIDLIK